MASPDGDARSSDNGRAARVARQMDSDSRALPRPRAAARRYFSAAQARAMRVQASFRASVEVA